MKLSDFTKKLIPLEISTLVIFIIYIIFPFRTPLFLSKFINTALGLIVILLVTLYLFFYTNPILGVVYIFVAYELLRRSAIASPSGDAYLVKNTPSEEKRQQEMVKMNPPQRHTLEEDVISTMAPSQYFGHDYAVETDFKPVTERIVGASLFK